MGEAPYTALEYEALNKTTTSPAPPILAVAVLPLWYVELNAPPLLVIPAVLLRLEYAPLILGNPAFTLIAN